MTEPFEWAAAERGEPDHEAATEDGCPIVVVLGVHRSGTSLCANVLDAIGVDMADDIAPHASNPKGHWERLEIVQIHDRILAALGRRYHDLCHDLPLPEAWWTQPAIETQRAELVDFLKQRMRRRPFGFKDPRTMRLLPMWRHIFAELRLRPKFVLCLRNPAQVARSLHARDVLDPAIAEHRWLCYMAAFFNDIWDADYCTIEYESWFDDPVANLSALCGFLDLPPSIASDPQITAAVAAIVDRDLRHDDAAAEPRVPLIREVYALARRAVQDAAARERAQELMLQVTEYRRAQSGLLAALEGEAASVAAARAAAERTCEELREKLARGEHALRTARSELAPLAAALQRAATQLAAADTDLPQDMTSVPSASDPPLPEAAPPPADSPCADQVSADQVSADQVSTESRALPEVKRPLTTDRASGIPRTAFLFWHDEAVPPDVADVIQSWRSIGGLETEIYSDRTARQFILDEFGERIAGLYDSCAFPVMRSDYFRLCRGLRRGGLYVDAGFKCVAAPEMFFDDDDDLICVRWWHGRIINGMFSCPPNSPVLQRIFERVTANIEQQSCNDIWSVTGAASWNFEIAGAGAVAGDKVKIVNHPELFPDYILPGQSTSSGRETERHWSHLQNTMSIFTSAAAPVHGLTAPRTISLAPGMSGSSGTLVPSFNAPRERAAEPVERPRAIAANESPSARRTIIVHYHLFKNAGTSVDAMLKHNFGSSWVNREFAWPNGGSNTAEVSAFLQDHPHIRVLSSHTALLPLPQLDDAEIFPILFLRHPLDRLKSAYLFHRDPSLDGYEPQLAKQFDFGGYARALLDTRGNRSARNFHAHRLAFNEDPDNGPEIDRALRTLAALPFVGLVEAYDESIGRLYKLLSAHYPNLVPLITHENVTRPQTASLEERLAGIAEELGPELYAELNEANADDLRLFEEARSRYA